MILDTVDIFLNKIFDDLANNKIDVSDFEKRGVKYKIMVTD